MPISIQTTTCEGATLLVWNITETEQELESLCLSQLSVLPSLSRIKHPLRRRQKLVSSLLIGLMTNGKQHGTAYSPAGKPYLEAHNPISFSNCKTAVAMISHSQEIGIDLEEHDERTLRIRDRFLHENERKWMTISDLNNKEALIWGVKESLFKAIGGGGIEFKTQLEVLLPEISDSGNSGEGWAYYHSNTEKRAFRYYFRNLADLLLVYAIAEPENKPA